MSSASKKALVFVGRHICNEEDESLAEKVATNQIVFEKWCIRRFQRSTGVKWPKRSEEHMWTEIQYRLDASFRSFMKDLTETEDSEYIYWRPCDPDGDETVSELAYWLNSGRKTAANVLAFRIMASIEKVDPHNIDIEVGNL